MRALLASILFCHAIALMAADSEDPGKAIFLQKCTSCHKLPATGTRTTKQWQLVVTVMQGIMQNKGMAALSEQEQNALMNFLASTSPAPESTVANDLRDTFVTRCALCHQLPDPAMFRMKQWQAVLVTMQTRMQQAGMDRLTQQEKNQILEYLSSQADH